MSKLKGKVAIVTGSDSGMGQAIAIAFAEEGADIAVTYHSDRTGAEHTAETVRAAGCRVLLHQLDVRDEACVQDLFKAVDRDLGTPDILVNNAGVGGGKPLVETSLADFDRVVRTDLYGPFLCSREFIARRRAQGGHGKIINITSVHEKIPSSGYAAYGCAKAGLLSMTRSLALELAEQKINVNAIAPGLVRTPMTMARTDDPQTRAREMPHIPWHRPGEPREIGLLAVYLASDDSDYVTGQSITIDGGLEMNWGQGA